ncbi:unnamed protein product [Microthlaspi erraticum]|uniref:DUF3741 domain-containing protein n=1 Tax=Microthlaspi erraticum TaxID=1685480 RepID=A0A6D2II83_9BRAS|nr:unnamed protein product [Microthlaspi erraticum]
MEVVERKRSRGGFLNLFDWPGKSRKKLFSSSSSEFSEEPKQTKQNTQNHQKSRLSPFEADEIGNNSSYNPRSESSCCASSVTSDDGQGTRAPSVVARLMGLESLPVPNVQEPRFNPDLDPFFLRSSRNTSKWNAYENLGYVNLRSDYDGISWEHLESRTNEGRNRPIERFQSETFPPRSAKPISVTNNRLLSPIRSPGFVPSRNPIYVMEAASRMIEPSPRIVARTRFSQSDSPSSVPMRIRDLREKLEAAQKVSSRQISNETYPSRKQNEKRTSTSVTAPSTSKLIGKRSSDGLKSKVKPPYVSAQAKASTTPLSVNRNNSASQKEKADAKKSIVKSQNGLRGPFISTGKKQNCRDNQPVMTSVSNHKSSKVINKVVNKVPVESGLLSKQLGLTTASGGKNTSLSLSRKKTLPRSKKPQNGMQESGISDDKRIKRGENLIKCNITIDGGLNSKKDDRKKEMDVISFTFSSPIKGLSFDSLSSTRGIDQDTDSTVSFNMIGGDSLNVLLEKKLRELTSKLESSSCSLTQEESSRFSAKDGVNGMISSSSEYEKSTQNRLDKVLSESDSVSDCTSFYYKQKFQMIQAEEHEVSSISTVTEADDLRSSCSKDTETKPHEDCLDLPNSQKEGEKQVMPRRTTSSSQFLVEYVSNDAKFVNERARNDFVLLSRGIMRLDARARQDVAILGSGFLKLDARAREDTEKIDRDVKRKAERLHHIATILKNIAQSKLKNAADKHWSDGALEADLRRADFRAKQRAMEDALMALEVKNKFIKNVHDMMVNKMVDSLGVTSETGITDRISLEKNGKALDFFPGEVSSDRISAIEEAYRGMASALSEADGIDYTDPEELELLVTTLIDLDAMDGKTSASLLAECSSSPDVNTR